MSEQQALLAKIHERRKEIAEQRVFLAGEIEQRQKLDAGLAQEEAELAITERNIVKFTEGELEHPITELGARLVATRVAMEAKQRGKRKPEGLPSVLVMAGTVLLERAERGQTWLEPSEIVTEIKKRWWADAEQEFISPQLWRAAKKGNLRKEGTRYALPENEKASSGVAAEASQTNGALLPPA